jgi:hypothetical protein
MLVVVGHLGPPYLHAPDFVGIVEAFDVDARPAAAVTSTLTAASSTASWVGAPDEAVRCRTHRAVPGLLVTRLPGVQCPVRRLEAA